MKKKLLLFFSVILVFASLIVPIYYQRYEPGGASYNLLLYMALISVIIVITLVVANYIIKRNVRGRIYIAYDYSKIDFVDELNSRLSAMKYVCYPNLSALVNGVQVKELNLDSQFEKSDILVVLMSDNNELSNYISYVIKSFKRQRKPIQIFGNQNTAHSTGITKSYLIFPLPENRADAISMIVRLINGCMLGLKLRKQK